MKKTNEIRIHDEMVKDMVKKLLGDDVIPLEPAPKLKKMLYDRYNKENLDQ